MPHWRVGALIWGKIIGAAAGFAVGGPFGAVVGAALGHAADQGQLPGGKLPFGLPKGGVFGAKLPGGFTGANLAGNLASLLGQRERYFSVASVVLSAKLAKSDGPVNRAEIEAFKHSFNIPPEAVGPVGRLFDQSRESAEGYEAVASQLGRTFHDQPARLEDLLAALFQIARADKPLTMAEHAYLQNVHAALGLDQTSWERASGSRSRPPPGVVRDDPYPVLGLSAKATDAEVRAAWKRLVRENHPDTQASRGASAAEVARASERVARINAAWDTIKHERNL